MKKIIYGLLICTMILLSVFSAGIAAPKGSDQKPIIQGELFKPGVTEKDQAEKTDNYIQDAGNANNNSSQFVYFDNLTAMLSALNAGRIQLAYMPDCTAEYTAAQNDSYAVLPQFPHMERIKNAISIGVSDQNADLLKSFNDGITALLGNGVLDDLKAKYIDGLLNGTEPDPVKLPVIDGAKTVRVVVTGDLPPLDYVSADGQPAGYNVALLSELSKVMNVNFELVTADAASRAAMLSSGRADAIFWMRKTSLYTMDGTFVRTDDETPEGVALSDAYYNSEIKALLLKDNLSQFTQN